MVNIYYISLFIGIVIASVSLSSSDEAAHDNTNQDVEFRDGADILILELGPGGCDSLDESASLRLIIATSSVESIHDALQGVQVKGTIASGILVHRNGTSECISNISNAFDSASLKNLFGDIQQDAHSTIATISMGGNGSVSREIRVDTRGIRERPSLIAAVPFFWEVAGDIKPQEVNLLIRKAKDVDLTTHILREADSFIRKSHPSISNADADAILIKILQDTEAQILQTSFIRNEVIKAIDISHRTWGGVRLVVGDNQDRSVESSDGASPPLIYTSLNTLDITDTNMMRKMLTNVDIESIIAEHVLEHLTLSEAMTALQLCYDALVEGGALYIAVPDYNWMIRDRLRQESPADSTIELGKKIEFLHSKGWLQKDIDAGHRVQYDVRSLTAVLTAVGFEVDVLEHTDARGMLVANYEDTWNCDEVPIRRSSKCGQSSSLSLIVRAIKPSPSLDSRSGMAHLLIDLTDTSLDESEVHTWEPVLRILLRQIFRSKHNRSLARVTIVISDNTMFTSHLYGILVSANKHAQVRATVLGELLKGSLRDFTHIITSAMTISHLKNAISHQFDRLSVVRVNTVASSSDDDDEEVSATPEISIDTFEKDLSAIASTRRIPTMLGLDPYYASDDVSDDDIARKVEAIRERVAAGAADSSLREHIMTSPYVVIPVARHQCRDALQCADLEASIRSIVAAFRGDERYRSAWESPPHKSFVLVFLGDLDIEARRERLGLEGVLCVSISRSMAPYEHRALLQGAYALIDVGAKHATYQMNGYDDRAISSVIRKFRLYSAFLGISLGCPVITEVPAGAIASVLEQSSRHKNSDNHFDHGAIVDKLVHSLERFDEGSVWRAMRRISSFYRLQDAAHAARMGNLELQSNVDSTMIALPEMIEYIWRNTAGWNALVSTIFNALFSNM